MTDTHDRDDQAPKEPIDRVFDSNLKASIWENEGEKGKFYATTFARTYRDEEGNYRDAHSFVGTDLLRLSELARKAYDRTNELRRDDREHTCENEPYRDTRRADFNERRGGNGERSRTSNRER